MAITRSSGSCRARTSARRRAFTYDPSVLQLDNSVSIRRISFRVGDLNNRRAGVIQPFEELHDLVALCRMEIAGRFVGEDQLWIHDYGAGYAHKLLLAAGKLVRKQIFLAHNVETVERVTNQAHALLARHVLVGKRYLKVFEYRQIVDQVIALEDKTHVCFVQFVALFYVQFVDGLSVKIKFAGPRAIQHADDAQQSGLSCPGRPHRSEERRVGKECRSRWSPYH